MEQGDVVYTKAQGRVKWFNSRTNRGVIDLSDPPLIRIGHEERCVMITLESGFKPDFGRYSPVGWVEARNPTLPN